MSAVAPWHASAAPRAGSRAGALQPLETMRDGLLGLFTEWTQAASRRRCVVQRRLLLGLELRWKVEEQLLLPALQEVDPELAPSIKAASGELDLLRDLSLLLGQTVSANRQIVMAVLEGLARLHFGRVDELISRTGTAPVDWAAMATEVEAELASWASEVAQHGAVEDEDVDPVGLPPR